MQECITFEGLNGKMTENVHVVKLPVGPRKQEIEAFTKDFPLPPKIQPTAHSHTAKATQGEKNKNAEPLIEHTRCS